MIDTSVIVPVWNRADLTRRFLGQNWQRYQDNLTVEWIVIDNGSTDITSSMLEYWQGAMGDRLTVITQSENIGFGPANNLGADTAQGDTLVFISNDVEVNGDYIAPLVGSVRKAPNALHGAQLFDWNTGWNNFDQAGVTPYLGGWCLACNIQFWQAIGGFDERYVPCDYEDLDLSYTVTQKGCRLIPVDLPLHHESGQSARALPEGRLKITLESQRKFLEKWNLTLA